MGKHFLANYEMGARRCLEVWDGCERGSSNEHLCFLPPDHEGPCICDICGDVLKPPNPELLSITIHEES